MEHALYTVVRICRQRKAPVLHLTLVAVYVAATNGFDLERWMAAFAHDALVSVELQAYWEKPASSKCAERDIIGGRLTMNVAIVINNLGTSLWRPGGR
jgi:hypothetical protein